MNDISFETLGELPKTYYTAIQARALSVYWNRYKGAKNRVVSSIIRCYSPTLLLICFLQVLNVVGQLTSPFLLQQIIDFVGIQGHSHSDTRILHGIVLLAALIFVRVATALVSQRADMQQQISGSQSLVGLGAMIYEKCLKISSQSSKNFSQGQLMNLMQMDCIRVSGIVNQLSNGISLVATLSLSMYLLYHFLGVVALVGVAICQSEPELSKEGHGIER